MIDALSFFLIHVGQFLLLRIHDALIVDKEPVSILVAVLEQIISIEKMHAIVSIMLKDVDTGPSFLVLVAP